MRKIFKEYARIFKEESPKRLLKRNIFGTAVTFFIFLIIFRISNLISKFFNLDAKPNFLFFLMLFPMVLMYLILKTKIYTELFGKEAKNK